MYAIRVDVDPRLRTNSALREYARMEYGSEDVAWFLSSVRAASRTTVRPSLRKRFLSRAPRPTHRPVACKGSPRYLPSDPASPG